MWRTEEQRSFACHLLLERVGLGKYWDPATGPTAQALKWKRKPRTMPGWSSGEFIVWRLAWDLYNGSGKFNLDEALATLDGDNLRVVGTFLTAFAYGGADLAAWCLNQDEELRQRYAAVARPPLRSVP